MEVGSRGGVGDSGRRGELGDGRTVSKSWCGGIFGYGGGIGKGSSVRDGGSDFGDGSRGVGEGCSGDRSDSLDGDSGGFLAHHSVKSVDRVSGVVDYTPGAIGLQKGVAALNEIAVTGLLLALVVAGQTVVHVVRVAVLGMRVVVSIDGLGDDSRSRGVGQACGGGRGVSQMCSRSRGVSQGCSRSRGVGQGGGGRDHAGISGGDQDGESDELRKKET